MPVAEYAEGEPPFTTWKFRTGGIEKKVRGCGSHQSTRASHLNLPSSDQPQPTFLYLSPRSASIIYG